MVRLASLLALVLPLTLVDARGINRSAPSAPPRDAQRAVSHADTRPNVLFVVFDDLNDWVGPLQGHPQAYTPAMDSVARRGVTFTNAHVQAPLCNPSRASFLTGLRPSTTGVYGLAPGIRAVPALAGRVTLPQHFAAHGYATAAFGKIFHDGSIPPGQRQREF